jgi:ferredoxin-NADP reductase
MQEKSTYTETPLFFIRRTQEVGGVSTYVFKPETPVSYASADYGHLRVLGLPEGVRAVREFSFASAPHQEEIEFGIKTKSESEYQKVLLSLQPGDRVGLFKIKHHMTWPAQSSHAVMIAGGVGITPFRSMLRDLEYRHIPIQTTVLHVSGDEFPYAEEIRARAGEYVASDRSSMIRNIETCVARYPAAHYYVAGSPGFTESVLAVLSEKGIAAESDPFKGLKD